MAQYKLLNYEKNDIVATGLDRPKTTAILFDKLWIPSDFRYSVLGQSLGYDEIPMEVCIIEDIEESIHINNNVHLLRSALLSGKNIKEVKFREKDIKGLRIMPYVGQNRPFYTVEEDVLGLEFMFSVNRNIGLKNVVKSFKKIYGIDIVPIYIGHTAFEDSILSYDEEMVNWQLQRYYHNMAINKIYNFDLFPIPNLAEFEEKTTCNAYEVCINNVPTIVENSLEWKQVLEMRRDKTSIDKVHRFRNWVDLELNGKSRSEVVELLEKALDDYGFALKKHGIMTALGGITTVLSSAATITEVITESFSSQLAAGFVVTAGIITYTAAQISDFFENKRAPIAVIYEIEQNVKTHKRKDK